ncbi:MAG: histidine phosphatase family protein [archaeon]
MKLFIIRHGQSTSDVEQKFGGTYDDLLTEVGKRQAQQLSSLLKYKGIRKIYHSPYKRAKETAEIISNYIHVPLECIENLKERNYFGVLSGMTQDSAKLKYPAELVKLENYPLEHDILESENYDLFSKRINSAIEMLLKSGSQIIAVVTHGGPIKHILHHFMKRDVNYIGECAYIEIDHIQGDFKVIGMHNVEMFN